MLFILTLSWQGKDKLLKLYPTLVNSLKNIPFKWFIKDNGSTDASIDCIKDENVNIIKYPHNRDNYSQGCNFLFNEIKPNDEDLIFLLNNDIYFKGTDSLKNMISLMTKDVGVVGAKLLYENNKIQHAGVVFHENTGTPIHFRARENDDLDASKNREFQAVTGAVLLTKAEYYRNIGFCDTKFIWCFDDTDICLSIKYNLNKKIVYCGQTKIIHEESATLKKNPVQNLFLSHNIKYFLDKWNGRYKIDRTLYTSNKKYNLI